MRLLLFFDGMGSMEGQVVPLGHLLLVMSSRELSGVQQSPCKKRKKKDGNVRRRDEGGWERALCHGGQKGIQ